jgi:proline dehydrogenase
MLLWARLAFSPLGSALCVARLPRLAGPPRPAGRDPVGPLMRHALLALSRSEVARAFVTHAPPAGAVARRFVAGETRADALRAVRELAARRTTATVAFLGEHTDERRQAESYAEEYIRLADDLAGQAHVSLKLSALGLDFDEALCRRLLERIAERATFVRIDMESSAST